MKSDNKQATIKREKQSGRVFGNDVFFIHDLFRLELASMKKNIAIDGQAPLWENVPHVHHFHSYDSAGRKQVKSTNIGGHFHEVTMVDEGDENNPPTIKLGPPAKYVSVRNRTSRQVERKVQLLDDDQHTHDVTYVRSDKLKPRRISEEFVKYQSKVESKAAPVDGVL